MRRDSPNGKRYVRKHGEERVAFGFDGPAAQGTRQGVVTGNPVRAEIEALPAPADRYAGRSGPLKLLVVGGSLGAQVLKMTPQNHDAAFAADLAVAQPYSLADWKARPLREKLMLVVGGLGAMAALTDTLVTAPMDKKLRRTVAETQALGALFGTLTVAKV